jgi:type VI secretion system protein ImpK
MRLTDCFVDLIAYVAYFLKTAPAKQPPLEQVKADIHRLMSETEQRFRQGGLSQEDYDLARFAVCAWVDEAVLSSAWNEKNRWQGEQLQRHYYQTADAGEMFFDRLNALGPHQRDVREVYYLCLAMGFMGRYCNEGDAYLLDQLKTSNLKLLSGSSVGVPTLERTELFPEAYPAGVGEPGRARKKFSLSAFNLLCLAAPVVLFLALFVIYRFVLGNVGETIIKG